ncbi:MAG: hypothetical protein BRD55_05070 [Bacteroidetes bacterium SW_9_63_38]|nr:MAG: hypothetical protein BRD55_05070 [Bacteroidetes bacterium SW_9_63_38]
MPSPDPCPERPHSEDDLDFTPQKMVRWFSPKELVRTGTEAVLSGLFGSYADWREVQALRAEHSRTHADASETNSALRKANEDEGIGEWYDLSDEGTLWLDYAADLGDGFNSTYSVARLLAEPELSLDGHGTERGRALIFGGDQVYPTASRRVYKNRLAGPYRAALPCVTDDTPPLLFAVPGNHDWYDGLTSFLRLFTQRRWIGGWKTQQRRSYFAIKLPHDWWLWGIDVQLESDIDEPQLNYFQAIASDADIMPPGSKVILCTPEPTWVYSETKGAKAFRNLGYFEDTVITANGHTMPVGLAGDLHTYARYEDPDTDDNTNKQRFIAGGGGAYLYPTHDLPDTLDLETPKGHESRYTLQNDRNTTPDDSLFPAPDRSRSMSWRALLLPFKNWTFGLFVAALYLVFAWLLESATILTLVAPAEAPTAVQNLPTLFESLADRANPIGAVGAVLSAIKHVPSAALLAVGLVGGLSAFADREGWEGKLAAGGIHAAAHLLLAVALMWGFAQFNLNLLGLSPTDYGHVGLFTLEMFTVGSLLGGVLMGGYLAVSNRLLGMHTNEVFSCQHIPDYKNVLRLRLDEEGDLTIYPVGIETVETKWSLQPDGTPEDPWFEGEKPISTRAELIEPPVNV